MHPRVFSEYERICRERKAGGAVLEIGAVPGERTLLNLEALAGAREKVGINLDGPYTGAGWHIVAGDANAMDCFEDGRFDTVLCNAVLEHDRFFWRALAEIRRVTKPGGLVVIGAPGFRRFLLERWGHAVFGRLPLAWRHANFLVSLTATHRVHDAPGDYYRFSAQAFEEVFFEGMRDVQVHSIMCPPRLFGSGIRP